MRRFNFVLYNDSGTFHEMTVDFTYETIKFRLMRQYLKPSRMAIA